MRYFNLHTEEQFQWYRKAINQEIDKTAEDELSDVEKALIAQLQSYLSLVALDLYSLERNLELLTTVRPMYERLYHSTSREYANRFVDNVIKEMGATVDRSFILQQVSASTNNFLNFGVDKAIASVDHTTKEKVSGIIAQIAKGELGLDVDDPDIAEKAKKVIEREYRKIVRARANTITRTEVSTSANRASWISAKASGLPLVKRWVSVIDLETRTGEFNHIHPNGQTVGLDNYFTVSGELLKYPLDPLASLGNRINCRCAMIFQIHNPVTVLEY